MLRLILMVFLSCSFLSGVCQQTKRVTRKNSFPSCKENFHVLKSDNEIKHGLYEQSYKGEIIVKGQFDNNQKTGSWEYYDGDGKLVQEYNFTTKEVLFDSKVAQVKFDTIKYTRPAIYIGGIQRMFRENMASLRYPAEANKNKIQGQVLLKAVITEEGEMVNETVLEGLGYGCDEEALRVFQLVPDEWIPALGKNGKPVKSEIIFPLTFRLN